MANFTDISVACSLRSDVKSIRDLSRVSVYLWVVFFFILNPDFPSDDALFRFVIE